MGKRKTKAKPKKTEVRICGGKPNGKPCTIKLKSGHQKWCPFCKLEVRKKQNRKSAERYAKKWGNQRLTTKQTAMIKLEGEKKPVRLSAKQTALSRMEKVGEMKPLTPKKESTVVVGGTAVEVLA